MTSDERTAYVPRDEARQSALPTTNLVPGLAPESTPSLKRVRMTFFIGCLLALCVLLPLWRALGAGLILGYFSEGMVAYLARRFRLQRWGRMLIAGALVGAVLLIFLIPIGVGIYKAGSELLPALHESALKLGLDSEALGDSFERWLGEQLARWNLSLSTSLLTELGLRLQQAGAAVLLALVGWLRGLVVATPRFIFDLTIVVVTWWLAAVEGPTQRERLLRWLLPWPQPRAILSRSVVEVLRGLIVANLAVAAVQAVVCTVALAVFRIPHALSLGVLTFFLAFVPVVGTGVVTLGSAAYLFSHSRVGAGLAMLLVALVAAVIDNLLRPFFLRGQVELPIPWIFLSIVGGIAGFGAAGVVLGPIMLSVCRSALRELEAEAASTPTPTPVPENLTKDD